MFCMRIKGKEKLLDGHWKHACHQKARVEIVDLCKSGEYYVSKECLHYRNKDIFPVPTERDTVIDYLNHGVAF